MTTVQTPKTRQDKTR